MSKFMEGLNFTSFWRSQFNENLFFTSFNVAYLWNCNYQH